jgi:hypothetical protein
MAAANMLKWQDDCRAFFFFQDKKVLMYTSRLRIKIRREFQDNVTVQITCFLILIFDIDQNAS